MLLKVFSFFFPLSLFLLFPFVSRFLTSKPRMLGSLARMSEVKNLFQCVGDLLLSKCHKFLFKGIRVSDRTREVLNQGTYYKWPGD